MEARRFHLEPTPTPLREILERAARLFEAGAAAKGVTLGLQIASEVPEWVLIDGPRLAQVLHNLLSNAVKFTPVGSITLRARMRPGPVEILEVEVEDTGIGIAPSRTDQIFQPYEQGDSSLTRRFGGTGLGLAIASRIVEAMDGRLRVSSEMGHGSRFYFRIPIRLAPRPAPLEPPKCRASLRGLRVLVAEDNAVNMMVIRKILEKNGATVTTAANGREAVDRWRREQPDLILMDLQMPDMDGISAARAIRSEAAAPRVPIVALTAQTVSEYREQCESAGMDGYLTKPLRESELLETLGGLTAIGAP
jgi:CheY-like chemotaxis protein